jgi:glycosyltransferase involved in cell wall biosynthesis
VDAVVLGYPSQPDAPLGWLVAQTRRAPLVVDAMIAVSDALGDRGVARPVHRGLRAVDRIAVGGASIVIADTGANAGWLRHEFGLDEERVAAVPVGADPEVFAPASPPAPMGHALFVGKLAPLHGLDVLLAASSGPGVPPIRIVGSGQLGPWLGAELARRDADAATISHVPWVPFAELGEEVRRASICLGVFSPSPRVGRVIPNKVWHAMAVGRPIVTADGPAPREVLRDRRDALLIPPGRSDALADALAELAADDELRSRLAISARRRFLSLGAPERVAQRFLAGISPVLGTPGPARS